MKKFTSLLVICIAVLCFFSSCAMEKPLEAKYTLYGSISYTNAKEEVITVPRCQLFLYPNGEYEITLINSGTWKIAEDDSNKVILTASDPDIFQKWNLSMMPNGIHWSKSIQRQPTKVLKSRESSDSMPPCNALAIRENQ